MLHPAPCTRTIERDLMTDETIYTVHGDGGEIGGASLARLDAIDLEIGYTILRRYRIGETDPLSARVEISQKTVLRRGSWMIRIETRSRMSATREAFLLSADLVACEGDDQVLSKNWDLSIKRDLV